MKATDPFKETIKNYLANLSKSDSLLTETLKKPKKNIDDCVTYILTEVKKSGKNGFADDEIFGMALHYYDEDSIVVGKSISSQVVVNHSLPPTPKAKVSTPPKKSESDKKVIPITRKPLAKTERKQLELFQTSLF